MNKKPVIIGVIALIIVILILTFKGDGVGNGAYKNATYMIEGKSVSLINGVSEVEAAPGSASKIVTKYFGNEVKLDFNDDGREDVAFLITQDGGGSGTFYYLVGAIKNKENDKDPYWGMQAVFLGDRISPQTTEYRNKQVIVNFADREGKSFSKYFDFVEGSLVETQPG
jgi:hypothetical protein